MSDKEYLLTYKKNGTVDFGWFDTKENGLKLFWTHI